MPNPGYLMHFGVKGMKWGQRKAKVLKTRGGSVVGEYSDRKEYKRDKKTLKKYESFRTQLEIHNRGADYFNANIDAINKKFANKNLGYNETSMSWESKAGKAYYKEVKNLQVSSLNKALKEMNLSNGSKKFKIVADAKRTDPITGDYSTMVKRIDK